MAVKSFIVHLHESLATDDFFSGSAKLTGENVEVVCAKFATLS
jgi:hypothetical protein